MEQALMSGLDAPTGLPTHGGLATSNLCSPHGCLFPHLKMGWYTSFKGSSESQYKMIAVRYILLGIWSEPS